MVMFPPNLDRKSSSDFRSFKLNLARISLLLCSIYCSSNSRASAPNLARIRTTQDEPLSLLYPTLSKISRICSQVESEYQSNEFIFLVYFIQRLFSNADGFTG
jgi:hypothetical protein